MKIVLLIEYIYFVRNMRTNANDNAEITTYQMIQRDNVNSNSKQ